MKLLLIKIKLGIAINSKCNQKYPNYLNNWILDIISSLKVVIIYKIRLSTHAIN